jgi:hypothetical protein
MFTNYRDASFAVCKLVQSPPRLRNNPLILQRLRKKYNHKARKYVTTVYNRRQVPYVANCSRTRDARYVKQDAQFIHFHYGYNKVLRRYL